MVAQHVGAPACAAPASWPRCGQGRGQSNPTWAQVVAEIKVARAAHAAVQAPFKLGTNG